VTFTSSGTPSNVSTRVAPLPAQNWTPLGAGAHAI
jgi:hypothetical protein